jgi:hypothetical protein
MTADGAVPRARYSAVIDRRYSQNRRADRTPKFAADAACR